MSNHQEKNPVKVMIFGTFDGLHLGHLNFFKQARDLGPAQATLIISVARDKNVFRIKKKFPIMSEKQRVNLLKKSRLADKVVLSGMEDYLPHILRERPTIIALGYDQKAYVKNLKKDLQNKGLIVKIIRLKAYKKEIFKNHLIRFKKK